MTRALLLLVLLLALASAVVAFQDYILSKENRSDLKRLIGFFAANHEENLPTWFSASLMLISGILLATIAMLKRTQGAGYVAHWAFLSFVFCLGSVDEVAQVHEATMAPLRGALDVGGFLYFAWVIPGGIALLVLGIAYLGFLRALPAWTRNRVLLGAALFISGGFGLELVGGSYREALGAHKTTGYQLLTTAEETLEMLGLVVFIHALISYVGREFGEVRVSIDRAVPDHADTLEAVELPE